MSRLPLARYMTLLSLVGLGCDPFAADPTAGASQLSDEVGVDEGVIDVRGRAQLLPEAAAHLERIGEPAAALERAAVELVEPLRLSVNDPGAILAIGTVGASGGFVASGARVQEIHTLLGARLGADRGLIDAVSVIYDTATTGTRPRLDILEAEVWALPLSFGQALSAAIGHDAIQWLTAGETTTLQQAGFVIGRVVDVAGEPLAGMQVLTDRPELQNRIFYPDVDLGAAGRGGTRSTGLFVYVHSGRDVEMLMLSVSGRSEYPPANVVAMEDRALIVTLSPIKAP